MSFGSSTGHALLTLMSAMPRGPRREGVFALWLFLRVAEDLFLVPPPPQRAVKRRLTALAHRLSSLTIPAPLRRALVTALAELEEAPRERVGQTLLLLAAPARDAVSPEAGDLLQRAARQRHGGTVA